MSKSILTSIALVAVAVLSAQSIQAQGTNTQTRPRDGIAPQGQRYQQSHDANKQGVSVTEAIAQKLMKANEAEIELAQMAGQKTDHAELRQLTQTIVRDHQALNQELKKCCEMNSTSATSSQNPQDQNLVQDRATDQSPTADKTIVETSMRTSTETVPQQLCEIMETACDNSLKMTKEMLGQYEGQDFQMAFLGQQCVAHTIMLAELNAIKSVGPAELKEVCSKAIPKVEQHLEKVKSLAKQLKDNPNSKG